MAALQHEPASPLPTAEIFGPTFTAERDLPMPKISYGLPFDRAVLNHVPGDARVFIIASRSLTNSTDSLQRLHASLGNRVVGTHIGMTSHTLFQECVEITEKAREANTDTVVTLGAGSIADGAKFVCKALSNDLSTLEQLDKFNVRYEDGKIVGFEGKSATTKLICIPTSLSAGENTSYAGVTDAQTLQKYQIFCVQASVTILDPWLALHTPLAIWMQSGVRAIDHCVENFLSPWAHEEVDKVCRRGLELLIPGLIGALKDTSGEDVPARLNAQLGVSLAILPVIWHVPGGASHGIGHMLGPMGVGHGETSCILLPAVCKYNKPVTRDRQRQLCEMLWRIPECKTSFEAKGLEEQEADLSDLLDAVIRALGMPRTLKEKGIVGDRVEELARMSLNDIFLKTNPIPITTESQVMEVLNMVRE